MTEPLLIALVAAIPPTLAALAALVVGLRNSRKVEEVRHATNSLADRLVESTRIAAHAAGVKEEHERLKPPLSAPGGEAPRSSPDRAPPPGGA